MDAVFGYFGGGSSAQSKKNKRLQQQQNERSSLPSLRQGHQKSLSFGVDDDFDDDDEDEDDDDDDEIERSSDEDTEKEEEEGKASGHRKKNKKNSKKNEKNKKNSKKRKDKLDALLDNDDNEDLEAAEDQAKSFEMLREKLDQSERLRVSGMRESKQRLLVARQQSAEFSRMVAKDLKDMEEKIVGGSTNDAEELIEMLKQTLEEAKAFAANATEEQKRAIREVGVDATHVMAADGKGEEGDGKEEEEEEEREAEEEEFDKVTDQVMADASDVATENINRENRNNNNNNNTGGFKKGFLMERNPNNAIEVEMKKLEEAKKRNGGGANPRESFLERAKYIPLRLDHDERKYLRLLEAALHVSEYTDVVDVQSWSSRSQRIARMIKEICAIMSGLVVASDYRAGQKLIQDREFKDNANFFGMIFEIGRRHKIMNPEKMRSEYGKMVYLLQDSQSPDVREMLSFKLVRPLKTAYWLLSESENGLDMLNDPLMSIATAEIMHEGKPRHEVQREIKQKERARETLSKKYAARDLSSEDILHVLYSIADNNAYLRYNRDPVDEMLKFLTDMFDPKTPEEGFSLGISTGMEGARLSHNHGRQYAYVSQSLMLWREVANDMFKLWYLAEHDLLRDNNRYTLQNTGQGLNRVQHSPQTLKCMHEILHRCQSKLGHWVGSSVIHLGDHNVPNALMFIDKYTQVARILAPVVLVVKELPKLASKNRELRQYIENAFDSVESCRKLILTDFFRHAFDGSGADNFFDAGSCIDGRLTSAWNWCSKIEKKSYYHVFKLCGFASFDSRDQ